MLPRDSFSDQHSIDTPEQLQLDLPLAGIGSRFLALAVDTLIQLGGVLVVILVLFLFGTSIIPAVGGESGPWVAGILIALIFLIWYGYYAIFEVLWNGQTPGKRMVGIRVIKDSGRPLTTGESIGRNLMRIIDQLPGFYAIGIVCALFNSQNKRLGDFLAGSIVVRETALKDLKPVWQAPPAREVPVAMGSASLEISVEELRLIDVFLVRRHSLERTVRTRTALQILERLKVELPADRSLTGPAESILEELAYRRRSTGHMTDRDRR